MKSYEKVQKWLDENGITQREFADRVGMTEVAMSRFLRGERLPHAPIVVNIASVMGIDNPWDLIKDDYEERGADSPKTKKKKIEMAENCFCEEKKGIYVLFDKEFQPVFGINGEDAYMKIRISKEQGYTGLSINYCPYCGRPLRTDE